MVAKRNTLSVRFNFDHKLDVLQEITASLVSQGLPGVTSDVHLPLAMSTGEGPSDEDVDAVVADLCAALERIASNLEPFTASFCGTGCFYNCGGDPDANVIFLTPYLPTAVRAAHQAIHAALQEAAAASGVLVSHYSHPDHWQPHLTIAKGVKRDTFTTVVHQVHEWAAAGPIFRQHVLDADAPLTPSRQKTGCYPAEVRYLGFKMTNYKGTGEARKWTFELCGDGQSEGVPERPQSARRRRRTPWEPVYVAAALCVGAWLLCRPRRP